MLKKTAQVIFRTLDSGGVLGALERMDSPGRLRVLMYHRIDHPSAEPDLDPGLISATPEEFREQMRLIAKYFKAVSLRTVLAAQRGEASLPCGAVLITFDDGYRDFASNAWPVLREFGLPAVLCVPTAYPDQVNGAGFWWDRLYAGLRRAGNREISLQGLGRFDLSASNGARVALGACKRYVKSLPHGNAMEWVAEVFDSLGDIPPVARILSWDSLRELASQGLDVCAHGHSHALCTRVTTQELIDDLTTCRNKLGSELGNAARDSVLAWPANHTNPRVGEIAQSLGFVMGFGGVRGVERLPIKNVMNVMRIPVSRYEAALFRAQLQPGIASLGRYMVDRPWRTVAK